MSGVFSFAGSHLLFKRNVLTLQLNKDLIKINKVRADASISYEIKISEITR